MHQYRRTKNGVTECFSIHKLWELSAELPAEFIPMEEFNLEFHGNQWDDDRGLMISPNDVLLNPAIYTTHMKRVTDSDLSYCILVMRIPRLVIIDGLHRLCKAELQGRTHMLVQVVPEEVLLKAQL